MYDSFIYCTPQNGVCQVFYLNLGYYIYMDKFYMRLKELRIERGLMQSELASQLTVNQRTISNWENNVREPNIDMIIKIAQFFDVSTDYLLGVID